MSVSLPPLPDLSWRDVSALNVIGPASGTIQVTVPTDAGQLVLSAHSFGIRMRLGESAVDYGLLVDVEEPQPVEIDEDAERIVIRGAKDRLALQKAGLAFEWERDNRALARSATDGHFVREHRLPAITRDATGWIVNLDLHADTQMYGLGEKWGRLDRRGQLVQSFNRDALGVNAEASYKNAPFGWTTSGWGVFVHTPSPVTHSVGFAPWSHRAYGLYVEDPVLDLFFFAGNGAQILDHYTCLTGRAPVPPLWSFGTIISKAYYKDADELLATARECRRRKLPCDTITLDGRAWLDTQTRFSFEWDASRYPDPETVLAELRRLNFKVCVWEYPLISVNNPLFHELATKGWLLKEQSTGDAYRFEWEREPFGEVLTPLPSSGLLDFTHPDAYNYWRDRHESLFEMGVDMIKADFGEQVPDDAVAHNGASGRALHNVYAFLYNRCVYEAAEKYAAHGAFLFSRSSWTGCQRFPAQWGGDPQADWEGMAANLRGGLSWGLTGAPYYATDVGGFYGDQRDPKLYVRWLQAAIFSAHLRLHGIGQREPWTYGPDAEAAAMKALNLRYRLLPYLSNVANVAHRTGLPVQRAMALACPDEPESWGFDHQFFFGDNFLVAPCIREDDRVSVYLPRGQWQRFPDEHRFEGGRVHQLTLALDEMAVFTRAGAQIPLGAPLQHTGEFEAVA